MRISSVYIDGFGIFHDESISGLSPGLVLFQGNNEAGKSTLLGFIRAILFGFPRANSADPNYYPLAGGTHGGRIGLVTNSGDEFMVERKPGKGGGLVSVTGPDGNAGGGEVLRQLLGGVTYEVFKSIYAFSLAELQTIDTLRAEGLKGVIYGASAGTAMLALPRANKRIKQRLDDLFKPGGRTPFINKKIAELEHIRSELRDASREITKYDQTCNELRQVEESAKSLQHDLSRITWDRQKLGSYARLWPEWIGLNESETALHVLGEVPESFPENGIVRLDKELSTLRSHQEHLSELEAGLQRLRQRAEDLSVDRLLLGQSQAIRLLLEKRNEYVGRLNALPLAGQERNSLDLEIRGLIPILGKDWTEQTVLSIDRSLFTRETIRRQEEDFIRLERELATAEKILGDKNNQHEKLLREESLAEKEVEGLGDPKEATNEQVILKLQHGRDEFAGAVRDIPGREDELVQEQQELARLIREVDPSWTETEVEDFDNSIGARRRVEDFASSLKQAEIALHDAQTRRSTIKNNLNRVLERHRIAVSKFEDSPKPSVESRQEVEKLRSCVQELRSTLMKSNELDREIRHQEERLSDRRNELDRLNDVGRGVPAGDYKRMAGLFAVLCVLVPGVLALFGRLLEAGITCGVLLVVVIGLIVLHHWKSRSGLKSPQSLVHPVKKEIEGIETILNTSRDQAMGLNEEIGRIASEMGLSEPVTVDVLNSLDNRVEKDIHSFEHQSHLAEEVLGLDGDVKHLERDCDDVGNEVDQCEKSLRAIDSEWKGELEKMKLSKELTTDLVVVIFSKVETARQQLKNINTVKNRIRQMEETLENYFALAREVPSLAGFCKAAGADFLAEVDRFFLQLKGQQKRREDRRLAQQTLEEKARLRADAHKDLKEALEIRNKEIKARAEAVGNWKTWLVEHGLPGDLSPKTALEAFDRINDCIENITKRDHLKTVVGDLETEIGRYRESVSIILSKLGRTPPDPEKTSVFVDELVSQLEDSKGNLREKNSIKGEIESTEAGVESAQGQVSRCRQRIAALLKEVEADNEDEFRNRGHLFSEKKRFLEEVSQAEKNMRRISGESDIGILRKSLDSLTIEEIQTREKELALKADGIERDLEDFRDKRAKLRQMIDAMKTADDIIRLRFDEERVLAEMQELASDWARYAMARYLIERAREKFEKEQQPRVIRDAGIFFRKITHSRYPELFAPIGEDTVEVITSRKERIKPEDLSRGTAEQLYMALRFGYIRNRAETSEPLPVIMDDILVNSDPIRAGEAAEAILELSKEQQVLFFTCHPETIGLFKTIDERVPLHFLEDGRLIGEG